LHHFQPVFIGIHLYHLHGFQPFKPGLLGDLVLPEILVCFQVPYICYVPYITNPVPKVFQIPEDKIEGNGRPGVPEMRVPVYRRTTYIHANEWRMEWLKDFFSPG
jgi:hypothetical protein